MSIAAITAWLTAYKYAILFPLAAVEGPIVSLAVGFLVFTGDLELIPAFTIMILGDLIPDSIYYYIGRWGNRSDVLKKYEKQLSLLSKNYEVIERLWHVHPRKTMFLSKLAYGFSIPALISSGLVKMPYMKFITLAIPVTFFQYGVIMTIGYYLGYSYDIAVQYVKDAYYVLGGLLLILVALYFIISRIAKKEIIKMEQ